MKLLFIHGIGQEGLTSEALLAKWTGIMIDQGFDRALLDAANPEMAYYADILDQLSGGRGAAQPMGASAADVAGSGAEEQAFLAEALREIGEQRGVTPAQAEAAAQLADAELGIAAAAPMSTALGRFGVGVLRLLEGVSPTLGEVSLCVLKQAYAYLKTPGVHEKIDARVLPHFAPGKTVVVAHSLGTIVAFRLLRDLARTDPTIETPLLLTLGSPLAQGAVRNALGLPLKRPATVGEWHNLYDRGDPVTLGKPLAPLYANGVSDDGTINNTTFNAHSIQGYLDQPKVHALLVRALTP